MTIRSVITVQQTLQTRVELEEGAVTLGRIDRPVALSLVNTGLTGAPGSSGQAQISADAGNALTQGSDQRLFVPATPGDRHLTHQQSTAADTWLVAHGLGKFPSVTVVDSAGDQVEGDVRFIDANTLLITFSAAFSGRAHLN